jgi:DNA-directed RNA polymerase subunit RPC12/RpoP
MNDKGAVGTGGEKDVVKLVACPNCGRKLQLLPKNYPMYDVQCKGCSFRAQVKTNDHKPMNTIYGAGWDILNHVCKAGYMIPPLIANFEWEEDGQEQQVILFFPFVPKGHIEKKTATRPNGKPLRMFNYVGLDKLPRIQLYPDAEETSTPLYTKTTPKK